MARGIANNEPIVSQAGNDAFREGHGRTFGDKPVQRGKWVYDVRLGRLVPADEYVPASRALDAPIMMDRFYENTKATDGTDIGSRRKHRQYMKDHGLTTADDFASDWKRAQARRDAVKEGKWADPGRREVIERAFYKIAGKP